MGIYKFLNLQILPWCFQLMGNLHVSCVQLHPHPDPPKPEPEPEQEQSMPPLREPSSTTVKIVKSDGQVKTYHRPVRASELMTEFPKHLVCRSDSFYIGQRIAALSEDDHLQLGQSYFLLPNHFFQSVLTFVTVASFVSSSASSRNAFLRMGATCQPFHMQRTPSGCLRIRVSDEFISELMEQGGKKKKNVEEDGEGCGDGYHHEKETIVGDGDSDVPKSRSALCTTPQLAREYAQLVVGSRQYWKPKLETIRETGEKKKGSTFIGMKRRKKSTSTFPSKALAVHKFQRWSERHAHRILRRPKLTVVR